MDEGVPLVSCDGCVGSVGSVGSVGRVGMVGSVGSVGRRRRPGRAAGARHVLVVLARSAVQRQALPTCDQERERAGCVHPWVRRGCNARILSIFRECPSQCCWRLSFSKGCHLRLVMSSASCHPTGRKRRRCDRRRPLRDGCTRRCKKGASRPRGGSAERRQVSRAGDWGLPKGAKGAFFY